jgi:hypothetical protein
MNNPENKNRNQFQNKVESTKNSQIQKTETAEFRGSVATSRIQKFAMYD